MRAGVWRACSGVLRRRRAGLALRPPCVAHLVCEGRGSGAGAGLDLGLQSSSCSEGEDGAAEKRGMEDLIRTERVMMSIDWGVGARVRTITISVLLGIKGKGHSACTASFLLLGSEGAQTLRTPSCLRFA